MGWVWVWNERTFAREELDEFDDAAGHVAFCGVGD